METILVLGANGQLGKCLKKIEQEYKLSYRFIFTDSTQVDITEEDQIEDYFSRYRPNYCINAAAYTFVDKAESEPDKAYAINAYGVENLAKVCSKFDTFFIHISTDYVFDGKTNIPYDEDNRAKPINIYGKSKLLGEELALQNCHKTIVIRTSWLYSEFNNNFVKTMLKLFKEKEQLNIVGDQYGQPTNANDLAQAIMKIVQSPIKKMGIYHFSNYPETTWFEFAKKVAEYSSSTIKLNEITTEKYPTPAARAKRTTLSLDKIEEVYAIEPINWKSSLKKLLNQLIN